MVMAQGPPFVPVAFATFGRGIGGVIRRDMDVRTVVIVVVGHFDERDRRPVGDVSHCVLGLRDPMQVHRRQDGDCEQRAEGSS